MKREKALFILAVLVMIIPNLGFTSMIEKIIYAALGIILILIAYGIHFDKKRKISKEKIIEPAHETPSAFEHQAKPRRTYVRREKPAPVPTPVVEESIDDVIVEAPKPKVPDSYGFTYVKKETRNERTS